MRRITSMWTYITRTDNTKLRLSVTAPLSEEEWEALTASLASLRPAVVSQGAQAVTRLLDDLQEAPMSPEEEERLATGNAATFRGPLDPSVMGLWLHSGDIAQVTESHAPAHIGVMHRWVGDRQDADYYLCGHGGCFAHVTVTREDT